MLQRDEPSFSKVRTKIAAEWPNLLVEAVSLLFLQEDSFGHILNDLDFKLRQ